ncbi:PREDICTED: calmodulin-binding transcription activator 2-like [Lupinus angustifolius]|uniref:calmodulin-binding transcription activator 2-like n=1 Tax=Lupinus angustifolius TaxID=3871 RepID=UPI00092F2D03|nr:PREDICTED: calmodulin-binding transcription activator 2-like [Lupinus angustifolius]XP_019440344.1 PREDICTED: calmodulin-binding transcription activator 2-like [Lupinus angustifolius]XP_019440345.1 PREDICTED: calmodulin-binding transcription activator 2-like [Lupinus angustifolius]
MGDAASCGLAHRLDIHQLQIEAQHRWLRPSEISEILRNYRMFHITPEPHNRPPSGSLFIFDRKVLRYFRKDGHNWRKKKDGKTVKEAHEKLKVGSIDALHCYYAHGEDNENFQRRSYWMLEPDMMHIVFVHYLEVKGNKTTIGGIREGDDVTSDSQRVTSPSSGFPSNYSSVPSPSTDSMSPTSSLTFSREDADSEDIHQGSSGLRPLHESQHKGNGILADKLNAGFNSSYLLHPISGDHGLSSTSGTDYIPFAPGDKFRGNDTTYIDGQKAHGMASWNNVLEQCTTELHTDPSLISFPSTPSGLVGNILDQEHTIFSDLLAGRSGLSEEAGSSRSLQSNWQIHFQDNSGNLPAIAQSLSLDFGSGYSIDLLGNETHVSSEIAPNLFSFHGTQKEQSVQQYYPEQHADRQSQLALKSNSVNKVPGEESINYAFTVKRTLLDRDESLKKVDSFSRWVSKELGEVDDLNMQSTPGISWSTDECGHVMDDASLSPSLSQDQLFSINDFSPKWAYAESETEVLIIGAFLKSQPEVTTCNWSCMFGEVEVPAEALANGILCCQAPSLKIGRVPFYVTCSNRLACSEVREFDYREGFSANVDFAGIYDSSSDMLLHLQLEELLSLKPVQPSNLTFEGYMEQRSIILKLISQREEEEYSSNEEPTLEMGISQQKVKEHLHRQVKEKLYSWLLHKATDSGKGPNILDKNGQGALHLASALGYDWGIKPILTAGVNINFRDVNGWTALHWAAFCGRERTVAVLVSMGADSGASTDPSPTFPSGRTPADLASSNGHKGISGFLAESLLTGHLESLTMDDQHKGGRQQLSGLNIVQTASERTATPVFYGDMPDALSLKDSLTAVRNAIQAADRIHQVFRMQSFQRKQLNQYEDEDELGLAEQQAVSLIASKSCKSGQGDGLANAAATQIQKKFRGWKKRQEFLFIRQRIVKIQAHVRGHQVRKKYGNIIWSVGILEKVILRWRRKGSGLRGFRQDALPKTPSQQSDPVKEDDYDFLKEGRKQSEEKFQKALSRVKSMVQYPEARAQYRRLLNVVEDVRQTKTCNMDLVNAEETVDSVEELIDIDMLLDDDNFIPIAFD